MLAVDSVSWVRFTGRTPVDSGNSRKTLSSWGRDVTIIGAPARGILELAGKKIANPMITYRAEDPTFFAKWGYPVTGLIGNAGFLDEIVVLYLGLYPALGFAR